MIYILLVPAVPLALFVGFLYLWPDFGGNPTKSRARKFALHSNYVRNRFENLAPTGINMSIRKIWSIFTELRRNRSHRKPPVSLPVVKTELGVPGEYPCRVTWLGHSGILAEMGDNLILIDPVLSRSPSPFPLLGTKRFSPHLPIEPGELSRVDMVIISHDHYDHLDYRSILKLRSGVSRFYVPLGVGSHLARWGVQQSKIRELGWWEEVSHDGFTIACAPARHFSGRGVFNRNSTLWCSWIIGSQKARIFFSGDSGYDTHFADIGRRYGPFDLGIMECGQYDPRWESIHMFPEQAVQAAVDIRAGLAMPVHWGLFSLSLHPWDDPVRRFTRHAKKQGLPFHVPMIGESFLPGQAHREKPWWNLV